MTHIAGYLVRVVRGSLWLTGTVTVVAVAALVAGVYLAEARAPLDVFDGTTAPGSHEWWETEGVDPTSGMANEYVNFCYKCHNKIFTELMATASAASHPITLACLSCHAKDRVYMDPEITSGPGAYGTPITRTEGAHIATRAKCADCHYQEAVELNDPQEAHSSIPIELGELTDADKSWSCKACHTKVDVDMVTRIRPALELEMHVEP